MQRLGLFGGSFDPVHHGHLILARAAREALGLESVVLMPARHSPHKLADRITPGDLRLAMLQAAIAGEEGLEVSDLELRREGPSYTVDTLRALQASRPGAEWHLLIGADQAERLGTWREPGELVRLARVVVLDRRGSMVPPGFQVVRCLLEISSTEVRNRVACGRSIRYLVPDAVAGLIARHGLYTPHP